MFNVNSFSQVGRVARINHFDAATKVVIATDRRAPDSNGNFQTRSTFNTVTIFNEKTRQYIREHVGTGDAVGCQGFIGSGNYDKDGTPVYTVDLVATQLGVVAKKRDNAAEEVGR